MDKTKALKRVELKGKGREILFEKILENGTLQDISRKYDMPYGTLQKWKRGIVSIPYGQFERLLIISGLDRTELSYELTDMKWGFVTWKSNPEKLEKLMLERAAKMNTRKSRQKAVKTVLRKYGDTFFNKIGLRSAEKGHTTEMEMQIIGLNKQLPKNVSFKMHFTINKSNVDFAYYNEKGKIIVIEEVMGARKKKSLVYFELAKIYDKILRVERPFIVTARYENKYKNKIERFPLEAAIWMLDNDIAVPIFMDIDIFRKARVSLIRKGKITSENKNKLEIFCRREVQNRNFSRGLNAQKNTVMNELEMKVQRVIKKHGFQPLGKKIIKTRYGTALVVDNFIPELNTAIVVTSTSLEDIVGSAFGLKMFCNKSINVVGVAADAKPRLNKVGKIYIRHVDKLCKSIYEFDNWLKLRASRSDR